MKIQGSCPRRSSGGHSKGKKKDAVFGFFKGRLQLRSITVKGVVAAVCDH
jgi:hypothetical protein